MFDWQQLVVGVIIAAAVFYVARRGLMRLRSFQKNKRAAADCSTGCGKCGDDSTVTTRPSTTVVQISRERTPGITRRDGT